MTYKVSAGIYQQEIVKGSGSVTAISGTIGASTFASKKGPLGPHLITGGWEEFVQVYGQSDIAWSPAHLTLKPALQQMTMFYGNRVVNNAKYAGLSLYYDNLNKNFFSKPFATGSSKDYESALRATKIVSFSNFLSANDNVTIDLGSIPVSQTFENTSNYTLDQLSKKIQSALNELGSGADCQVIKAWNLSDRKESILLTFNREFAENDIISFKIKAIGVEEKEIGVNYVESSEATLNALASAINAISGLSAIIAAGDTPILKVTCDKAGPANLTVFDQNIEAADLEMAISISQEGHGVYDDQVLLITLPENLDDLEIAGQVEGSAVEVSVESDCKVMDIFAENPGAWASNLETGLGIKITGLDSGIQQRIRLTLSKAISAGESFECNIGYKGKTYQVGNIEFSETSDNTLKLIAEAIKKCIDENVVEGADVYVEEVVGGTENDRNIMIIGPNANIDISVDNAMFTGSDSAPLVTTKEVVPNTPANQQFTLAVYSRESISEPLESWVCSMNSQLDSTGNQMFVEDKINKGAYESANIRVVMYSDDYSKLQEISSIAWLSGGDDGVIPTNSDIINGWDEFADPEKITVRLLIGAGYSNVDVVQHIAEIAKNRHDAVALLDIPSDKQKAKDVADYRKYEMNVNTSYAACYSPDVLVFDEVTGTDVYVAPSGYAAAAICYTERNWAIYWAAAGLTRGLMSSAKGVRYKYNEAERDLVEGVHVNPIRDMGSSGIVIFGEYTTQSQVDPLTDLHVRLLVNNISIYEADSLVYKLFDPNDEWSRADMVKEISAYLKPIQEGRGLRNYQVISDINTESAADVDAGACVVKVKLWPTSSLKYIMVKNYVLGSGVAVDEEIG